MRSPPVTTVIFLALLLCGGCTPAVEIYLDENADFGSYRTWSWLSTSARTIQAPTPYRIGLDRQLARLVERELAERGFERVARDGDLRVGAVLNVRREYEIVVETGAVEQLSSYTSDGAYEIQRSVARRETYERSRLVVFAVHPGSGEVVWKGALEKRVKGEFPPHVGTLTGGLLASFPSAAGGTSPPRPPAPRLATPGAHTAGPTPALEPDA